MADRFRNWTFVVYPDSAPENWISILNNLHLTFGVSPLHDSDLNGDMSEKKPHWHVLLVFSGVQTYNQVCELIKPLNCTIPQVCKNTIGLIRYFVHCDNPEKHQYEISDIQSFGGFSEYVEQAFKLSSRRASVILDEIMQFIHDHKIYEFSVLYSYAGSNPDWSYVLNMYPCRSVYALLASYRNQMKQNG